MCRNLTQTEREVIEAMRKLHPILRMKAWGYIVGLAQSGSVEGANSVAELAEAAEKARPNKPQGTPPGD